MTRETPAAGQGAAAQARDPYQDEALVRKLLDRCIDDARNNHARRARDLADLFNLLAYRGGADNQWVWNNNGRVEPQPYDGPNGIPRWVPRCVTNKYAKAIDGTAGILNQSSPSKSWGPKTDDDDDLATADVAENADPVLLEEIGYEALKREAHQLIALTDKVAWNYYYDNDERHGMADIGLLQCLDCQELTTPMDAGGDPAPELPADVDVELAEPGGEGEEETFTCPACGSHSLVPASDPRTGMPIGMPYPKGKICAELWCSYEFSLPSTARSADAKRNPWVLGHQEMAVDDACRDFPDHADAIRRSAVGGGVSRSELTRQYAEIARTMSAPRASSGNSGGSGKTVMVYRLQHDPIKDDELDFPGGLLAVRVGDVLVEKGPLPLQDANGQRRKSILIRRFQDVPLSPFGKPPADDLLPLQQKRNRHESLTELILMHHAAPTTYLPAGVELIDEQTGMPGLTTRYRSMNGEKPFVERGINPPEGLYRSIEMIDEDMEKQSGLNSVLKGERPEGNPTLGEVEMLREQGMSSFSTPLDHLVSFERDQSLLLLDFARQTAWAPRFRRVMGENKQWEISKFTAADLRGQVDLVIEPISAWPKSPSMQLMKLEKAIGLGVLNPAQDPEVAGKVLTLLDLAELKPSLEADYMQVARMLDRWKAATTPQEIEPPDLAVIEAPIHLHLVKSFLKTEGAEAIKTQNPPVWQAMVAYVQQLQLALMPAPTDAAPQGPDGSAVQGAVDAGVLTPAGAEPPAPAAPNPMQAAVDSGALTPQGAVDAGQQPAGPSIDQLLESGTLFPAPQAPPGA